MKLLPTPLKMLAILSFTTLISSSCFLEDADPAPIPTATPNATSTATTLPNHIPDEMIGVTRTISNLIIRTPVNIIGSEITLEGVQYVSPPSNQLIYVKDTRIVFRTPYPVLEPSTWGSDLVVIEDSTVILEMAQPLPQSTAFLWPFSKVTNSTIIYEGAPMAYNASPIPVTVELPQEIFTQDNRFIFKGSGQPVTLSKEGTKYSFQGWVGDQLELTDKSIVSLEDSVLNDVFAYGTSHVELDNSTTKGIVGIREDTSANIINSVLIGPIRVSGTSHISLVDTSLSRVTLSGTSQGRLNRISAGESEFITISATENTNLEILDSTLPSGRKAQVLVVGDQSKVSLLNIDGLSGEHLYFGDATVLIASSQTSKLELQKVFLKDNATLNVVDSQIGDVYLDDNALLEIDNTIINRLYSKKTVLGKAKMTGQVITGKVDSVDPILKGNSIILDQQPVIFVPEGSVFDASGSIIKTLIVEGEALIKDSFLDELRVTGANSKVTVSGGSIKKYYYSIHSKDPQGIIHGGKNPEGVTTIEATLNNDVSVGEKILGTIFVTGDDVVEIRNLSVERIVASDDARATLININFSNLETVDRAVMFVRHSDAKKLDTISKSQVVSKRPTGQIMASGESTITIEMSNIPSNAVASEQSQMYVIYSNIGTVVAEDRASVTLKNSSTDNLIAMDKSRISAISSTTTNDTYLSDSSEITFICSTSRDLFLRNGTEPDVNSILWLINPSGENQESCDQESFRYPISGNVSVIAYPQFKTQAQYETKKLGYPTISHVLLIDGKAKTDGTFTSQEMDIGPFGPSPVTYILKTSNIEEGLHSLILVAKDQNEIEKRWATYLDIE